MSRLKGTFKGLKQATKDDVKGATDSDRNPVKKAKALARGVGSRVVESGAKGKVDAAQKQISGKLDEISGQAIYQLVQERLAEQERFNDLIATKLHEALERISELEKRIADK